MTTREWVKKCTQDGEGEKFVVHVVVSLPRLPMAGTRGMKSPKRTGSTQNVFC